MIKLRKIQTLRELKEYVEKANKRLHYTYKANFRYALRRNYGLSYHTLVQVFESEKEQPNDTAQFKKTVCGQHGLRYWAMLQYLNNDITDYEHSLGYTITDEL